MALSSPGPPVAMADASTPTRGWAAKMSIDMSAPSRSWSRHGASSSIWSSIATMRRSTTACISSSLSRKWRYTAVGSVPRALPSARKVMVSPVAARSIAAVTITSRSSC